MKKRILSALMATLFCVMSIGTVSVSAETENLILSDTTKVNVENTDTCFAKVTDSEYHADSNYYMHFKSSGDWLEVAQNLTETAVAGGQYVITVVAKPVSGKVWFRVGWDDTGWLVSSQTDLATELGDGWLKYEKTITMTGDQSNVLFHNDGAAEIYVDSISLKPVDGDNELLPNGGLDAVAYDVSNGTITANSTTVNVANTDAVFAEMEREELAADNEYSLHFKATAGDWLEVTQNLTETATAGGQYVLTAYVKPVTGKVWFYIDWDATGWMATHAADVIAPQPDGWTMVQKTITMTEDKAKLLFHNDGATEMYIDDISLVPVGGTGNLVPDGGFGEVTVEGGEEPPVVEPEEPAVDVPDEDLTLSDTTRISADSEICYARVTDNEKNSGNYSLHFYTEGDWLEIAQDYTEALAAGTYTLTWYAKGTGRVWFYSNWGTEFAATHSVDSAVEQSNGWTKYTRTLQIDGNGDTSFLFHGDGAVDQYIDDISLVDANGINYIKDGGFEEVTVAGAEPDEPVVDIPDEDLILSDTTHISIDNTENCFAKVTDNEKNSGSYGLHLKTGASDWLEVTQNLTGTATAGGQYVFTAYIKPVTGKVWFRVSWDDAGWMVSDQEGTVQANGWTKIEKTITMAADQTTLLFHNDGETEMYIDDISLVGADGIDLIPDGGFEDVAIAGEEPPHEHAYEGVVTTEPTHTEAGVKTFTCECGDTYTEEIPAKADEHEYDEGVVTTEPTHTEAGVKKFTCICGDSYTEEIPANVDAHEYDEGVVTKEPTDTEEGIKTYTCICGEQRTEEIPATGTGGPTSGDGATDDPCDTEHSWNEGVVTLEPTTAEEGIMTYTCSVCGETKTEAIPVCKPGDIDGDAVIDTKDVISIRRLIVGGYGIKAFQAAADVVKDGIIGLKDVITIRRFVVGGYGIEL